MPNKKRHKKDQQDWDFGNGYTSKNSQDGSSYPGYPPVPDSHYYQHKDAAKRTPTRAQLTAYDNYGYSSPGYSVPAAYPSSYDPYYKMPFSQDSGRKSRYTIPPTTTTDPSSSNSGGDSEVTNASSGRRRSLRVKVVLVIVLLLVFIAVAIGVAVYFTTRQMSEDNERMGEKPTTAVTPPPPQPKVEVSLRVKNKEYSTDLADPNSNTYKTAKQEMEAFMDASMRNSNISESFNRSEVTGFKNGSIIVIYIMHFNEPDEEVGQGPQKGLDIMKEIVKNSNIIQEAIKEGTEKLMKANKTSIQVDTTVIAVVVTIPTTPRPGQTTSILPDTTATTTTTTTATTSSESTTATTTDTVTTPQPTATSSEPTTATATTTDTVTTSQPTTSEPTTTTTTAKSQTPEPATTQTLEMTTSSSSSSSSSSEASTTTAAAAATTTEKISTEASSTTSEEPATTTSQETTTSVPTATTVPGTTVASSAKPTANTATTATSSEQSSTSTLTVPETTTQMSSAETTSTSKAGPVTPETTTVSSESTTGTATTTGAATTTGTTATSAENVTAPATTSVSDTTITPSKDTTVVSEVTTVRSSQGSTTVSQASTTTEEAATTGTSQHASTDTSSTEPSENVTQPTTTMTTEQSASVSSSTPSMTTSPPTTTDANMMTLTAATASSTTAAADDATTAAGENVTQPSTTVGVTTVPPIQDTTSSAGSNDTESAFTSTMTLSDSTWQDDYYNTSSEAFQQLAQSVEVEINTYMTMSDAGPVINRTVVTDASPGSVVLEVDFTLKRRSSLTDGQQMAMYDDLSRDDGTKVMGYFEQGLGRYKKDKVPRLKLSKVRFQPRKARCPGWPEVDRVMTHSCMATYSLLTSATTTQDACRYYSDTIKCAAFVLRTQHRNCSVGQLHQRMYKGKNFVSKQAGKMDVRRVCKVSSMKFSSDLDSTPLCKNTDALVYIAKYITTQTSHGVTSGADHSGMTTMTTQSGFGGGGSSGGFGSGNQLPYTTGSWHAGGKSPPTTVPSGNPSHTKWPFYTTYPTHRPSNNNSNTWPYYTTYPTHKPSNSTRWFTGMPSYTTPTSTSSSGYASSYPSNPCLAAMTRASSVMSVLRSLGLNCPPENVSTLLMQQDWSSTPQIRAEVKLCDDYMKQLQNGPHRCYNLSAPAVQKACLSSYSIFFLPTVKPSSEVCSALEESVQCSSRESGCSLEASRRAALEYLSFLHILSHTLQVTIPNTNPRHIATAFSCDTAGSGSGSGGWTTPYPTYPTPSQRPGLKTEARFVAQIKTNMTWHQDMSNPSSAIFNQTALNITQPVDAAFVNSELGPIYAHSRLQYLQPGSVYAVLLVSVYIDLDIKYHSLYLSLNDTFITQQFSKGFLKIHPPNFAVKDIKFSKFTGDVPLSECPAWNTLWTAVNGTCSFSVKAFRAATSVNSACRHYGASLKCVALVSKARNYSCDLDTVKSMAVKDSFLFSNHPKGFNVQQMCNDKDVQLVGDVKTPICESPDAYTYIADYICTENGPTTSYTHYPYHTSTYPYGFTGKTWMTYKTSTMPDSKEYLTTQKYPSHPQQTGYWTTPKYPSNSQYTGYWTTPKYPSNSQYTGYWTTPKYPSHPQQTGYWTTPKYPSNSQYTGYWTTPKYPFGTDTTVPKDWTTQTHGYGSKTPGYWTTGKYPPYTTGKYPPYTTGKYPPYTTEKYPPYTTGTYPPYTTGKYPPYTTGKYPPYTTGKYPPYTTGKYPPYTTGKYPPYTTGKYPLYTTGKYPPYTTGKYPPYTTGKYPPYTTGKYPPYTTGKYPLYTTGKYPPYTTYSTYPWATKRTSYPWWMTSTTHMPSSEILCSGFTRRAECIHNTFKSLGVTCPMNKVYSVLGRYNETILTAEAKKCEADSMKILRDDCFSQEAASKCHADLYMLYTTYVPDNVCSWWYGRALACVRKNVDNKKCSGRAVDTAWRKYIQLLTLLRHADPRMAGLNLPLVQKLFQCPVNDSQQGKKECPSYPDILKLSSDRCYPIYASLFVPNSSGNNCTGMTMADTAHTPRTMQQRCQLYGDLVRCLALAMKEEYECDSKDLQEKMQEEHTNVLANLGVQPHQCKDQVPAKYNGPADACQSEELYELVLKYSCGHILNSSTMNQQTTTRCAKFFFAVSCLSRESARMIRYKKCSNADVMSALNNSVNSTSDNSTASVFPAANSTLKDFIMAAYPSCQNQTVLVGGSGEVLLRQGKTWASVCGYGWGQEEGQVLCRQLGFQYGRAFNRSGNSYVNLLGRVSPGFSHFQCAGKESSLMECEHRSYPSCTAYNQMAAVVCSNVELKYELVPGKLGASYGYVQLSREEGTGLVCSQHTGPKEAATLCRAAGFSFGGMVYPFTLDPPAPKRVWRNYLQCSKGDQDIEGCTSRAWHFGPPSRANDSDGMLMGYPCDGSRGNLVQVFCFKASVKLHTGLFNSSGVPEIVTGGENSPQRVLSFCHASFTKAAADLFCKQIGFAKGGVALAYNPYNSSSSSSSYSGQNHYVSCTGQEQQFTDCKMYFGSYCSQVAAVRCHHDPEPGVNDLDVRLRATSYDPSRLILVYYKGEWGTICADNWTDAEADAVCKSLNYEGGYAGTKSRGPYLPHLIHNVTCPPNSKGLAGCSFMEITSDLCRYTNAAAAVCYNKETLAEYRLAGGAGSNNNAGYVHVTYNKTEGLLCTSNMADVHYNILCRQLGFVGGEKYYPDTPIPNATVVWGTSLNYGCSEMSSNLESCRTWKWNTVSNAAAADNGTVLPKPSCHASFKAAFCYSSKVNLHSGFHNTTGVLQLYYKGSHHYINREGLTQAALNTLCGLATGIPGTTATLLPSRLFVGLKNRLGVSLDSSCVEAAGKAVDGCVAKSAYYGQDYAAAVRCRPKQVTEAEEDTIAGWTLDRAGRVMAKKMGTWGTVCGDNFNGTAVQLFCKSRGYMGGYRTSYVPTNGRVPMWVASVSCPVDASHFSNCTVNETATAATATANASQCYTQSGASVRCYSYEEYVELRLVDTSSTTTGGNTITGRVVASRNGTSGYLCPGWKMDNTFAHALCRLLNYSSGGFFPGNVSTLPGPNSSSPAWSARLSCRPGAPESSATKCLTGWSPDSLLVHSTSGCGPKQVPTPCARNLATVTCYTYSVPVFFIVDNQTLSSSRPQGRIAVRYNGTTAYFCSNTVTKPEPYDTMCRLMGYPRGGEGLATASLPKADTYTSGWDGQLTCGQWDRNIHPVPCIKSWRKSPLYYQSASSSGNVPTNSLTECGKHIPAVSCFASENYRLVSQSSDKSQGLLVVWNKQMQRWQQVCRSGFGSAEANAACRQLGFSPGGQVIGEGQKPEMYYSTGPLRFTCAGASGEKLSGCSVASTTASCSQSAPVWLKCGSPK